MSDLLKSIEIIFENNDLLVINKPAGIVSVPGAGVSFGETVAGWLKEKEGDKILGVGQSDRWGVVHRLDRFTSGVMVLAKNEEAYSFLKDQFRQRKIGKYYLALSWGQPRDEVFIINAPIDRHPKIRNRYIVKESGLPAKTACYVLGSLKISELGQSVKDADNSLTLLMCRLFSGRTHQIRVHLKSMGTPLFGDYSYSGRRKFRYAQPFIDRIFLHAYCLTFYLSESAKESTSFFVDLPGDLSGFLNEYSQLDWQPLIDAGLEKLSKTN